jgi:glucose-6-phosphate 1-dehydrogenase
LWNRTYIRSIQIKMAENFGVEGRGQFYEESGAIRDVIQKSSFPGAGDSWDGPPTGEECDPIRDEKAGILKAVKPLEIPDVVRGQFQGLQAGKRYRAGFQSGDLRSH